MNEIKREHGGDEARIELLIVASYLISRCYDASHVSHRGEAVAFAKEHYGVNIRPDRATTILSHLYELSHTHPEILPFRVESIATKQGRLKYYVVCRQFSEEEILSIGSSIASDSTKTRKSANAMLDKFLSVTLAESLKESYLAKIEKEKSKHQTMHLSEGEDKILGLLEEARDRQSLLRFRLIGPAKFESHNQAFAKHFARSKADPNAMFFGYVHEILQVGKHRKVVLDIPLTSSCIIVQLDYLALYSFDEAYSPEIGPKDFVFSDSRYGDVDSWLEDHYKGKDDFAMSIKLRWSDEDKVKSSRLMRSIQNYFKISKDNFYKTPVKRERLVTDPKTGEYTTESYDSFDIGVQLQSNISAFRNWYMDGMTFLDVSIVYPKSLNDRLLGPLTYELSNRLNSLGSRYEVNFELRRK